MWTAFYDDNHKRDVLYLKSLLAGQDVSSDSGAGSLLSDVWRGPL